MEPTHVLFYSILALVLFMYVRRRLFLRSLPQYTPHEAAEKVKQHAAVLLDVRTSDERRLGAIRGSLHIPLHEVRRRANELEKHKHQEIICYCATGSRSLSAAATLKTLGFTTGNLEGGFGEWKLSGMK